MTQLLTTKAVDIKIDEIDWPRCHRCQMPVESFRVSDTGDGLIFVAACHGVEELVNFPDEMWDTIIGTHVNFGPAFCNKENIDGEKKLDR